MLGIRDNGRLAAVYRWSVDVAVAGFFCRVCAVGANEKLGFVSILTYKLWRVIHRWARCEFQRMTAIIEVNNSQELPLVPLVLWDSQALLHTGM